MKRILIPAILLGVLCAVTEAVETKPNVIVIFGDDLGRADLGAQGIRKDIRTPNLDRLAQQGAVLECLYGQPVCSPTRAALLTGRYRRMNTNKVTPIFPNAEWNWPV